MEIDLKTYYRMIRKRLWVVALCAVLFTLPTALFTKDTYHPIYQASTDFIVNHFSNPQQRIDYNELSVIIKTPAIIDKVAQWYPELHLTARQLSSVMNVSDVNGSRVMRITTQDYSYEKAVNMANDTMQVIQSELPKLMKVDNITILNPASLTNKPQPVNPKSHKYIQVIILSFLASLVVSIGIIFLLDSLDDTLRTEQDIRSIFGKSTLAVVPKIKARKLRPAEKIKSSTQTGEAIYAAGNE